MILLAEAKEEFIQKKDQFAKVLTYDNLLVGSKQSEF